MVPDRTTAAGSGDQVYSGIDNLEVMSEARRYAAFLCYLIARAGGTSARKSVVDFGAGTGMFADLCRSSAMQLTCIEPDPELRQRLDARGFAVAVSSSEVASASQDFIYTLNVLEHIEDDQAAVGELYRMLKPGGRLLVYVPAFACLYSAMDRKVGHLRRYRRSTLIHLLENSGFAIEYAAYADSLGFLASLAYRLVGSADGNIDQRALVFYDRFVFPLSRLIDRLVGRFFGKNVFAVAIKPAV
ncbi:MAG: class I SAM-dependent methyltransferase [Ferrovibrio sp.]